MASVWETDASCQGTPQGVAATGAGTAAPVKRTERSFS